jgi:hypothetical protein
MNQKMSLPEIAKINLSIINECITEILLESQKLPEN